MSIDINYASFPGVTKNSTSWLRTPGLIVTITHNYDLSQSISTTKDIFSYSYEIFFEISSQIYPDFTIAALFQESMEHMIKQSLEEVSVQTHKGT